MSENLERQNPQRNEPPTSNPSASEVDDWAARERKRREAWLSGPTEAEKEIWARREHERRLAEFESGGGPRRPTADPRRALQRYVREMQLATEGAMSLLFKMSLNDMFDNLVRAGHDWEEEFAAQPPRRRRVALEVDAETREGGSAPGRVQPPPEGSPRSE